MGLRVASLFMLWLALSYANEIRKGRTRNHGHYVCSTWGNNHFKTFDGDIYQFPGICEYNFASDCREPYKEFSIHIQRALNSNNHPEIQYILLTIKDFTVYLRPKLVVVDGQIVKTPHYSSGVVIESNDIYTKVYAKLGLILIWNQEDALMVELDSKFNNHTCGLCGDYNGVPIYNEFVNGDESYNSIMYGNLQKINKPSAKCEDPDETQAIPSCNGHHDECERLLTSSAFADCRLRLNLEMYIQACMQDKCACNGSEDSFCLCSTISEYSRQCSHAGGRPGEWRTRSFCPKTCPDTMIYRESSSPCMDTCSHLEISSLCEEHYMDGCFCPEGTVYDDITEKGCIPVSQCHCKLHGNEYSPGESITNECEECTCDSGRWTCKDLPCPGTCSVEGGSHIATFDGKKYTFHGDCYYVLSKGFVNDSHALLAELAPCGSTDRHTCLKTVVLLVDDKKNVVVFRSDGSVLLNEMTVNVPHVSASFSVFKPSSYYLVVQTSFGLQLQIQLFPVMQLFATVDQSVQGKLQGLCGNFNGMEGDDFKTTSGLVEATGAAFANTWKAQSTCTDQAEKLEDPCSLSIESANYAEHWCSLLKNSEGPFARCHLIIDPSEYYKKCKYDTCLCEDSEECLCAALSSYSRACALKGIILGGWRQSVCTSEVSACPGNQIFLYNLTMCQQTCRSLADGEKHCLQDFAPVDGCGCPYNTYLDNQDTCVPISKCPCYYKGSYLEPGEYVTKDGERCVCRNAKIQCISVTARMQSVTECSSNKTYFDCDSSPSWNSQTPVQLSCHTPQTDHFQAECVSGCVCPEGLFDDGKGGCVEEKDCPCIHNNQWYSPGQQVTVDCNICTCQKGVWSCTEDVCYGTCMIYGSGHYITFDGKFYDFDGSCEYVATQDFCGDRNSSGSFSIITENVPCGTTGVTCSKAIKMFLGKTELKLENKDYKEIQRDTGDDVHYWNKTVGLYLVIEASNGVMLIWDKKTTVFIKLTPDYKGKVCGLCGNFDDKSNNDFTTRSGLQDTSALKFGNSWKQSSMCPDVTEEIKPCDVKPHRKSWAEKECSIIQSEVFKICHSKVDPIPFYEACVHDACSCDSGGDCECFCSAVAAYAQECTKHQACVFWRTPDICPIFCDYYNPRNECDWHYEPCGSNIMTCRIINNVSTNFSVPYLEGCYPRCPDDKPVYNEETKECVTEDQCWCYINGTHVPPGHEITTEENCTKCVCGPSGSIQCTPIPGCPCVINGTSYEVGEIVAQIQDGDICITYVCAENGSIVVGSTYPCPTSTSPTTISTSFPTSTLTTTVTTTSPPITTTPCFGLICNWTEWFDVSKPEEDGGDYETYDAIRNQYGNKICEAPENIECRAKDNPDVSLEELGQKVECNVTYGLICKNEDQDATIWQLCYNYEIRVNCCEWHEISCETTSTQHPTQTATATTTSTTVPITSTARQPTTITTTSIPTSTITSEFTPSVTTPVTPTSPGRPSSTMSTGSLPPLSTTAPTPTPLEPPSSTASTSAPPSTTTGNTVGTSTTVPATSTLTPTTVSTSTPTPTYTTTTPPPECDCVWTDWIDVSYPDSSDRNSGDYETFENILKNDPSWVCVKAENISCRAKKLPTVPIEDLGQKVECNVNVGLTCNNSDQVIGGIMLIPVCLNYEISVCCIPNIPECIPTSATTSTTTALPSSTMRTGSFPTLSTTTPTPKASELPTTTTISNLETSASILPTSTTAQIITRTPTAPPTKRQELTTKTMSTKTSESPTPEPTTSTTISQPPVSTTPVTATTSGFTATVSTTKTTTSSPTPSGTPHHSTTIVMETSSHETTSPGTGSPTSTSPTTTISTTSSGSPTPEPTTSSTVSQPPVSTTPVTATASGFTATVSTTKTTTSSPTPSGTPQHSTTIVTETSSHKTTSPGTGSPTSTSPTTTISTTSSGSPTPEPTTSTTVSRPPVSTTPVTATTSGVTEIELTTRTTISNPTPSGPPSPTTTVVTETSSPLTPTATSSMLTRSSLTTTTGSGSPTPEPTTSTTISLPLVSTTPVTATMSGVTETGSTTKTTTSSPTPSGTPQHSTTIVMETSSHETTSPGTGSPTSTSPTTTISTTSSESPTPEPTTSTTVPRPPVSTTPVTATTSGVTEIGLTTKTTISSPIPSGPPASTITVVTETSSPLTPTATSSMLTRSPVTTTTGSGSLTPEPTTSTTVSPPLVPTASVTATTSGVTETGSTTKTTTSSPTPSGTPQHSTTIVTETSSHETTSPGTGSPTSTSPTTTISTTSSGSPTPEPTTSTTVSRPPVSTTPVTATTSGVTEIGLTTRTTISNPTPSGPPSPTTTVVTETSSPLTPTATSSMLTRSPVTTTTSSGSLTSESTTSTTVSQPPVSTTPVTATTSGFTATGSTTKTTTSSPTPSGTPQHSTTIVTETSSHETTSRGTGSPTSTSPTTTISTTSSGSPTPEATTSSTVSQPPVSTTPVTATASGFTATGSTTKTTTSSPTPSGTPQHSTTIVTETSSHETTSRGTGSPTSTSPTTTISTTSSGSPTPEPTTSTTVSRPPVSTTPVTAATPGVTEIGLTTRTTISNPTASRPPSPTTTVVTETSSPLTPTATSSMLTRSPVPATTGSGSLTPEPTTSTAVSPPLVPTASVTATTSGVTETGSTTKTTTSSPTPSGTPHHSTTIVMETLSHETTSPGTGSPTSTSPTTTISTTSSGSPTPEPTTSSTVSQPPVSTTPVTATTSGFTATGSTTKTTTSSPTPSGTPQHSTTIVTETSSHETTSPGTGSPTSTSPTTTISTTSSGSPTPEPTTSTTVSRPPVSTTPVTATTSGVTEIGVTTKTTISSPTPSGPPPTTTTVITETSSLLTTTATSSMLTKSTVTPTTSSGSPTPESTTSTTVSPPLVPTASVTATTSGVTETGSTTKTTTSSPTPSGTPQHSTTIVTETSSHETTSPGTGSPTSTSPTTTISTTSSGSPTPEPTTSTTVPEPPVSTTPVTATTSGVTEIGLTTKTTISSPTPSGPPASTTTVVTETSSPLTPTATSSMLTRSSLTTTTGSGSPTPEPTTSTTISLPLVSTTPVTATTSGVTEIGLTTKTTLSSPTPSGPPPTTTTVVTETSSPLTTTATISTSTRSSVATTSSGSPTPELTTSATVSRPPVSTTPVTATTSGVTEIGLTTKTTLSSPTPSGPPPTTTTVVTETSSPLTTTASLSTSTASAVTTTTTSSVSPTPEVTARTTLSPPAVSTTPVTVTTSGVTEIGSTSKTTISSPTPSRPHATTTTVVTETSSPLTTTATLSMTTASTVTTTTSSGSPTPEPTTSTTVSPPLVSTTPVTATTSGVTETESTSKTTISRPTPSGPPSPTTTVVTETSSPMTTAATSTTATGSTVTSTTTSGISTSETIAHTTVSPPLVSTTPMTATTSGVTETGMTTKTTTLGPTTSKLLPFSTPTVTETGSPLSSTAAYATLVRSTAINTATTVGLSSAEPTASTTVPQSSVSSPMSVTTSGTTPTESFTMTSGTTSSNFTTITATTTTSSGSTNMSVPIATSSAVTIPGSSTYSTVTKFSASSSTLSLPPTTPGKNCSISPNESYAPGESWWLCNCTKAICIEDDIIQVVPIICNPPPKPTCANGLSPVQVIDEDGCCWHWECDCYCTGWGDPHYMTFDGLYYSYQGNCTYVLVEEIDKKVDSFGVYIDNYNCDVQDVVSCPRTLIVRHETQEVRIATVKQNTLEVEVTVNKQAVALPYKKFGVSIYESGINRVVEIPELKMNVTYNGLSFSIRMPYSLFGNNTQGQCGTCNNNTADDCMLPNGNIAENCEVMADHWQVIDPSKPQCSPGLIPTKAPSTTPTQPCKESSICELLLGSVFEPCHGRVRPEKYYSACVFDSCVLPNLDLECSSLQIYAATCADQSICIDWRSHTDGVCSYTCPSDKEYRACGPIKEITCKSSQQNETSTKQVEGCFCPNGTMLYDSGVDVCVKTCGCVGVDKIPREFGEKFTVDCQDCICLEGGNGIVCKPHECAKQNKTTCDGEGLHEVSEVNPDDSCCPIVTCKCNTNLCSTNARRCTLGFEVHSYIPSGQCCPVYQCVPKRVCVHQNAEFLPNSSVFVDKCQNCFCTNEVNVSTQLNIISCERIPCNTYCKPGYEHQPVEGECCGRCVQTKCIIQTANNSELILSPGEFENDPNNNCTIYHCVNIQDHLLSSKSEITCPAFNEDSCKPGTIAFLPNGCCKTCIPLDSPTPCSVRQRKDFIHYKGCRSVDRVVMTECEGTCGTFSLYSAEANSLDHSCSCCRESRTTMKKVKLRCPNGSSISHKYIYVESCSCQDTECSNSRSSELQTTEENDESSTLDRIKRAISLTSK
ncbi:mucin-2 [Neopsephotus bourkii]|uniref:mucin-2 n=1 Tax=Neopsephotus bourkii TaxID=309878 RepID=UPI002AA5ABC9|nr:mucin-2 [Neopsephotus bourkii]